MKNSKGKNRFYLTTAIDYVNSLPHIGTAYEKIGADILARWMRRKGYEVHFQMGNDEHSTNVIKAARKAELAPKKYCDSMRKEFEDVWKKLNISYDDFIQTSEERHIKGTQDLFQKIYDAGDIYKSNYEGWYCESCEAFYTEKDLVDGVCPNHKAKPKWITEENYFFALTKYQKRLLDHIEKNPKFIEPQWRKNEVVSMIKQGLIDVSVSRSGFEWGIPIPFDKNHVVYVWFDALSNYITAVGYGSDAKKFKKWWPAGVHVIGKDIIRFHCVIWPAMLMSADVELPKTVFAHGFVTSGGVKMSKTLGNVVAPMDVVNKYGTDALRYFLVRGSSFGKDADFTWGNFIDRYNAELANGIGNLVARTAGMINQYLDGKVPKISKPVLSLEGVEQKVDEALDYSKGDVEFHTALAAIMEAVTATDKFINENKPWELAKKGETAKVAEVLGNVYDAIGTLSDIISPFIPETAEKIVRQMNFKTRKIGKVENLFPRIEAKLEARSTKQETGKDSKMETTNHQRLTTNDQRPITNDQIDITDFAKIQLKVAEIKAAEKVEGADKLLKLIVDLGGETRQIVAGIAKNYTPEDLIGKKIVVVANLKPAKLRGIESSGMLLAASSGDAISILTLDKDVPSGSNVK